MSIKDDETSMQWLIQLGTVHTVEVAPGSKPTRPPGQPQTVDHAHYEFINENIFGALRAPIYASSGPPNPKGLATPMCLRSHRNPYEVSKIMYTVATCKDLLSYYISRAFHGRRRLYILVQFILIYETSCLQP